MAAQFDDYDFRSLTDAELLTLIAKGTEGNRSDAKASIRDQRAARGALKEFRQRYQKFVNRLARGARSRLFCSIRPEEITDDVFVTVSERAHYFNHDPANSERAEHHRICVWLGPPVCHNIIRRLNDKELLVCVARRDEGEYARDVAEKAFAEFDGRYRKLLRWRCSMFTWGIYSEMEVEELVQEVMLKVWLKAHTYDNKGISIQKNLHGLTVGWLNEMAYHHHLDRLRRSKDVETIACEDEEKLDYYRWHQTWQCFLSSGNPEGRLPDDEWKAELLERASEYAEEALLKVLTDLERIVYQTNEQDFPSEEAREAAFKVLDERLGIKPGYRRTILCRAKQKIQKHMQTRMEEYLREIGIERAPEIE